MKDFKAAGVISSTKTALYLGIIKMFHSLHNIGPAPHILDFVNIGRLQLKIRHNTTFELFFLTMVSETD